MIKLKIDVLNELKKAGYNTNQMRIKKIMSQSTIDNIRQNTKTGAPLNISTKTINIICELLKLQPGAVLEWVPDQETTK